MVVIHFPDRLLKGFADRTQWNKDPDSSRFIELSKHRLGPIERVPLTDAKAVFFVNSFEGNARHRDLRFHDDLVPLDRVWIRLTFTDNEVMEGMVENTGELLLKPCFFLEPVDPDSNNWLIRVFKDQLRDVRILGLRRGATTPNRPTRTLPG